MDAGVPVEQHVAGIAMGMLLENDGAGDADMDATAIILTDITGTEDALGTMDFKVAGNRDGVSAFQLDIKCEGLTVATMERALAQARDGRLHIIEQMEKAQPVYRPELPATVPKMLRGEIERGKIGRLIGPGGKTITGIIETFGLADVDVDRDSGKFSVAGFDQVKMQAAMDHIMALMEGDGGRGGRGGGGGGGVSRPKEYAGPAPVIGEVYEGIVKGVHNFGVFLEIMPPAADGSYGGLEGLCHVSALATERVRNCEGFMASLGVEKLKVVYLGKNDRGKLSLSRKDFLTGKRTKPVAPEGEATQPNGEGAPDAAEVEVIARAIEGLSE